MSGVQLVVGGGLLTGAGLVGLARALRPAPPSLALALANLSASPAARTPTTSTLPAGWPRLLVALLPDGLVAWASTRVGVSDPDLAVIGWTRSHLATRKVAFALAGLLAPAVIGALLLLAGAGGYAVFPAVLSVSLAVAGWILPTLEAKDQARAARAEFTMNLELLATLVAGERRARGSVEQALEEAAAISGSVPFTAMLQAVRRAALGGRRPWADLHALGVELDIPELRNLADIAGVAADGAAVYQTLLATTKTLRHKRLSDARAAANEVSERMSRPLALAVFGLALFVLVPFMARMLTAT